MTLIQDLSDKGKRQGKLLRYEVGYCCTGRDDEIPVYVAKFRSYGDALAWATHLATTPDATLVVLRS